MRSSAHHLAPIVVLAGVVACQTQPPPKVEPVEPSKQQPAPPIAERRPHEVVAPAGTRVDDYYWLRDDERKDPDVLRYLERENAYTDAIVAPVKELREQIYNEIIARIKKDDASVPFHYRGYHYYRRFEPTSEYPIYARKKGSLDAAEQIMLDANVQAKSHDFYSVGNWKVSPNASLLAIAEDTVGRRQFVLRVVDLSTGEFLPDRVENITGSIAWADDNRTLFYVEKDPVTLLGTRVKRHVLGEEASTDSLVHEESDNSFYMGVGRTGDDAFITIRLSSTVSNEVRYLPAAEPLAEPKILQPRERNHEYSADHISGRWVLRTNWQATNFRLMQVADGAVGDKAAWKELIPHDPAVFIEDFELFDDYLVISERSDGLLRLRTRDWKTSTDSFVPTDESAYAMWPTTNMEQGTVWLRYVYTSMTTPATTYEINMQTRQRRLLKRQPILGGFDAANYETERRWATARDGTRVPVSLVYRKGFERNGTAPLYQYGYGSYGASNDPSFNMTMLSLLDRGFVYAIAHIRGGQEMGRAWYDNGKLMAKRNTFTDFIDVTEFLVAEGYAAADKVVAGGASAGGLLIGAVMNMRPDLYRVMIARVPFVDVLTTMLDETIPLTTNEFDEWGNPKQPEAYKYMATYSPYDNIEAKAYPTLLVTTGLWDSQVQYFEPAKWVAKLRAHRTDNNVMLLQTDMESGHGGASGRFKHHERRALVFAFVLQQLGMTAP